MAPRFIWKRKPRSRGKADEVKDAQLVEEYLKDKEPKKVEEGVRRYNKPYTFR